MDSILTSRGAEGGEHEASRRMKTELLIQMDGVRSSSSSGSKGGSEQVFVMAASNLPWDLDVAVLRRLEKRVLVPLPGAEARQSMVAKHLAGRTSGDVSYADVAAQTEGYSGADIELVCREAAMIPVRRLVAKLNSLPEPGPKAAGKGAGGAHHPFPMRPQYGQHAVAPAADVDALLKADPITATDVRAALLTTKPSSDSSCMDKYIAWQNEFGSV
jgi:katanin p60 ATPase-containing subunit A1